MRSPSTMPWLILFVLCYIYPGAKGFVAPVRFGRVRIICITGSHHAARQPVRNFSLFDSAMDSTTDIPENNPNSILSTMPPPSSPLEWLSLGMSGIYLAHFSSLYTQLPGLFGQTGLLPISDRISELTDNLWALHFLPSPELGMEVFGALGILIAATQIIFRQARYGMLGVVLFSAEWIFWHDLVIAGGRFMAYQMDLLVLDAAPLTVLLASGISPAATRFGFSWLLARLYIGAGAVKLLSCDSSWRNLSAVHWHFQSQPLPNPIGAAAYLHLPESIAQLTTLAVLVMEMALPFLFLVESYNIRRVAFCLNVLLMVGIALFGNFGSLQALLIVVGFALLVKDDEYFTVADRATESALLAGKQSSEMVKITTTSTRDNVGSSVSSAITVVATVLATWATLWTLHDVGARCLDTWVVDPLVYGLLAVGAAAACLPLLKSTGVDGTIAGILSLLIFAGSAPTMASGLGVYLPFSSSFEFLNLGASPYGLFATITGVGGRPVAVIEAALSSEGPWHYIPLLYQVNDPTAPLPLCFPHFPRLDWTLWFIPFGEQGLWIARFFDGIVNNDPTVTSLVDETALRQAFPTETPAIVRVVPRRYHVDSSGKGWIAAEDSRYSKSPVLATFSRGDLESLEGRLRDTAEPWPSTPIIHPLSRAFERPEYYVWGCIGTAEAARRAAKMKESND